MRATRAARPIFYLPANNIVAFNRCRSRSRRHLLNSLNSLVSAVVMGGKDGDGLLLGPTFLSSHTRSSHCDPKSSSVALSIKIHLIATSYFQRSVLRTRKSNRESSL